MDGSSSSIIFGLRHQRAADRAPSAARRRRCSRPASARAFLQARKIAVDQLEVGGDRAAPSRRVKAPVSRFSSTDEVAEAVAAFHRPGCSRGAPDRWGVRPSMRSPANSIEPLVTSPRSRADQVRDRLQGRGFAGAVGAEQRDDAAAAAPSATRPSAPGSRDRKSTSILLDPEQLLAPLIAAGPAETDWEGASDTEDNSGGRCGQCGVQRVSGRRGGRSRFVDD